MSGDVLIRNRVREVRDLLDDLSVVQDKGTIQRWRKRLNWLEQDLGEEFGHREETDHGKVIVDEEKLKRTFRTLHEKRQPTEEEAKEMVEELKE